MNNLIILEGCDRTGKTTFAEKLVNLGYQYFHFSSPKKDEDVYETYMTFLNSLDPLKKYVVDRFHLGELVYGPIYRGECNLSKKQVKNIESLINKFNHKLIHFTNTPEFIIKKFKEIGEAYTKPEHVELIVQNFKKCFNESNVLNKDEFIIGKKETIKFNL